MKEKNIYNIEDLIQDDSFRMWVLQKEQNSYWDDFAIDSQNNARLVENAKSFLLLFDYNEVRFSQDFVESEFEALREKLNITPKRKNKQTLSLLLVSLTFLIMSVGYVIHNYGNIDINTVSTEPEGLIEQINNSNSPKLITLSDGSSVVLQPKSKLSFSKDFGEIKREVFLEGEAFFEVSNDKFKPFLVFSNDVLTQVYGTSFRVIAYNELDKIKVIVKTGKVKIRKTNVSEQSHLREITLLPNQAALFDKKEDLFEKVLEISESDALSSSLSEIDKSNFEFVDTHISEIFSTIQKIYNIKVQFPDKIFENCYVTTSLSDVPLPEKLKILSFSIGNNTTYEIVGNKVIISSDGCNEN
ncbi:MAG: FecR family protein [Flavobacteriaceae bacterium]